MTRARSSEDRRPLPPPLPPAERTVGQVVAEAIRLYGRRFSASLLVGVGPAAVGAAGTLLDLRPLHTVVPGGILLGASYVLAVRIATDAPGAPWATALLAAALVFVPFAVLLRFLILPGILWLALVALAVPAIAVERLGLLAGFRRGLQLARADFVHALGGFAALWLVVFLTQGVLAFVLRDQADQAQQTAILLATLVVSPVFFLGAALLYADQAARVVDSGSRKPRKGRGDADLHPALDADGAGGADAAVEPGAAARGEP